MKDYYDFTDDITELLGAVAADIVSFQRYEVAVARLMAAPEHAWLDCESLCTGLPVLPAVLARFREKEGVRLFAAWHYTPATPGDAGEGYCLIQFYSPELNALANSAVYNRSHLLER